MDVLGNLKKAGNEAASLLGIVEKAVIDIYDRRDELVELAGERTRNLLADAGDILIGGHREVYRESLALAGSSKKSYVVRFNPSSLRIRARGRSIISVRGHGEKDAKVTEPDPRVTTMFSVQLVFDEVTAKGSFMESRLNTAPSALVQNAGGAVKSLATDSVDPGVQRDVEGFIAALGAEGTRHVAFRWGELYYEGFMNQVTAQYVMFNTLGQPVRAYVELSIREKETKMPGEILGPRWKKAYEEAFTGTLDLTNASQKVGNLLNLGL